VERLRQLAGFACRSPSTYPVGCVLADAEFDSERNHTFCREQLKADSIIPAKRGKNTWKIHGVRAQMRADFPRAKYARRSLIETVFSVAKRKASTGRNPRTGEPMSIKASSQPKFKAGKGLKDAVN